MVLMLAVSRNLAFAIDVVRDRGSEALLRAAGTAGIEEEGKVALAVGAAGIGFDRHARQDGLQRPTLIRALNVALLNGAKPCGTMVPAVTASAYSKV